MAQLKPFSFEALLPEPAIGPPDLSDTEREILREFAQPGGMIHKVMLSFVAYQRDIEREIARTLVGDPATDRLIRDRQVMAAMIKWQVDQWESLLTINKTGESE